jgi:hypothetical protein
LQRAALQRDAMDATAPQVQTIFGWMAEQVAQRNPAGKNPVVLLMDGQDSLWKAGWDYLPEELADVTEILDLLHALASLWEAAHLFHPNGSKAARAFVKEEARRILHGEVAAVIHSLRWLGTHHQLKGKRRETLERICGYFHNNNRKPGENRGENRGKPRTDPSRPTKVLHLGRVACAVSAPGQQSWTSLARSRRHHG